MSFLSPPSPPNPYQTAQAQSQFNTQAAQKQQQMNMINQYTPYGSLNYSSDPNAPGGYSATQTLSPVLQQLLGLMQQGQVGAGTAAAGLGGQLAGLYGQPANLDTQSLTNQMMNWQNQSIQPYWDIQKSNLEAQLQNQGLNPERCRLAECNDVIHQGYRAGAESVLYPGRAAGFQSGPYPVSTSLAELCIIDGHEPAAESKLCECSARTSSTARLSGSYAAAICTTKPAIWKHDARLIRCSDSLGRWMG